MAAYFSGTIAALKKGITQMSISAAVRNIENWEESLQDVELTGCRAILRDLAALKKQLQEEEPDGERIRHLMARLANQTIAVGERADGRYADKIANLGELLADAAESAESEDYETTQQSSKSSSKAKQTNDDDHDEDGRFAKGNSAGEQRNSSSSSRSTSTAQRHGDGGTRARDSSESQGSARSGRGDTRMK
jgi:hypothetical protein